MRSMTKIGAVALLAATALFGATAANAATIADPDGVLLMTEVVTIAPDALEFDLNNSDGWVSTKAVGGDTFEYGLLDENAQCNLRNAVHAYNKVDITVTKAGTYTFRIVDGTGDLLATDPYMALFEDFNPEDLDPGVVGCNDDESGTDFGWVTGDTVPGYADGGYDEHFSWFTVNLTPGNYTVMLTSWSGVPAVDWVTTESSTFEFWGPDCGIEGIECSLADTGVDATPSLLAGFGLLAAGIAAVLVRRRLVK